MSAFEQFFPCSISDRAFWEGVKARPDLARTIAEIEKTAESAPPTPAAPLATDFLAAKRSNNRAILDRWWGHDRAVLGALALRRLLKGIDKSDPDDLLLNHLWVQTTQATWVVSAHLPNNELPTSTHSTIDLASSQMAANLAEICETLKDWMDSVSATLYERVIQEIDDRVLSPFVDSAPMTYWWESGRSNWSGVCAGYILAACQSFEAMGKPRPQAKVRALSALRSFVNNAFTASGECDEGVGYWGYGFGCAVQGWMRLPIDEYLDAFDQDRFSLVASYPRRAHLFDNFFYAGNDSNMSNTCPNWMGEFLSASTADKWFDAWASRSDPPTGAQAFSTLIRSVQAEPLLETTHGAETVIPAVFLPDQQVAILRSDTPSGEMIAILEGGHNNELHNHNDIGQFQFIVNKEVVIPDLGNMQYTADFFGPNRYQYLAASSRGHNCPVVNGEYQRPGIDAAAKVCLWDASAGKLEIDASAAYGADATLTSWHRSLARISNAGYAVHDTFETSQPNIPISLRIWSTAPVERAGDALFTFGPLSLALSKSPISFNIAQVSGSDERLITYRDKTLYCLELSYRTDENQGMDVLQAFSLNDRSQFSSTKNNKK